MGPLLRRHVQLFLLIVLGMAGIQVVIWVGAWIDDYRTPAPVKIVRQLLDALRKDDCTRALTYLAEPSRSELAAETPRPPSRYSYCWRRAQKQFISLREDTARLVSQAAGRAIVRIDHSRPDPTSYLLPGFWATRSIITPVTLDLVEEAGGWKVVMQ